MDVLRRDIASFLLEYVDDILAIVTGLSDLSPSHSHTPTEIEDRGRKSHIPSVTTVPREVTLASGDRQARRRPIAVREGQTKKTVPLTAVTIEETTVADASLTHCTPNNVGDSRLDNRSAPVGGRDSTTDSLPEGGSTLGRSAPNTTEIAEAFPTTATRKGSTPNMVKSRGSTRDVTICKPSVTVKSDKTRKQAAPLIHEQHQATAVLCHKCGRRYQPDVDGYLRHHPRFCRSRRY